MLASQYRSGTQTDHSTTGTDAFLPGVRLPMPLTKQATYLRERAPRLREIAAIEASSPLYRQLMDMTDDLEERALDLEQEQATAEARAALEKARKRR